jgi:coatomer subunit beta
VSQLKEQLENGDLAVKISALKKIILLTLNGQPLPQLLMSVIRFCMPQKDKTMKKLLLLFWELCEKTGPDGKLLHEMILVWYASDFRFHFISPFKIRFVSLPRDHRFNVALFHFIHFDLQQPFS